MGEIRMLVGWEAIGGALQMTGRRARDLRPLGLPVYYLGSRPVVHLDTLDAWVRSQCAPKHRRRRVPPAKPAALRFAA